MSTTEIIEAPQSAVAAPTQVPTNSPMGMMLAAMSQGATLEQVEKMMDLQERWEHREAEKAFNDSMAAFKAEAVEIIKRREVDFANKGGGRTNYKHAELSDVVEAVGPALSRHGFAWSWKTEQTNGTIRVTCILKHRQGHSDSVTLEAGADQSGGKNSIQAIVSTVTYLERHTLKAVAGVSEKGDDNDGRSADAQASSDLRDELISKVAQAETEAELEAIWQKDGNALYAMNNLADYDAFKRAVLDKKKILKEGS